MVALRDKVMKEDYIQYWELWVELFYTAGTRFAGNPLLNLNLVLDVIIHNPRGRSSAGVMDTAPVAVVEGTAIEGLTDQKTPQNWNYQRKTSRYGTNFILI